MTPPQERTPRVVLAEPEDELSTLLRQLQRLIVRHPAAAQAMFSAFVAEGRAFALSEQGKRWRDRLIGSALIRRGRAVWEVGTLNMLEEDRDVVLPSKLLEAVVNGSSIEALEPFLSQLFENNIGMPR